jgi:hypothetical protein
MTGVYGLQLALSHVWWRSRGTWAAAAVFAADRRLGAFLKGCVYSKLAFFFYHHPCYQGAKKVFLCFLLQATKTRFFLESSNGQVKNTECQQRSAPTSAAWGGAPHLRLSASARRALPAGCRAPPALGRSLPRSRCCWRRLEREHSLYAEAQYLP